MEKKETWSPLQERLLAAAQAVVSDADEVGDVVKVDSHIFADLAVVVKEISAEAAKLVYQGGERR